MAARSPAPMPEVVELTAIGAESLDPVLAEEVLAWRSRLNWDYRASLDLVRRYVAIHGLTGCALLLKKKVIGYSYSVCEEHKGLVGDLYILEAHRGGAADRKLLEATVGALLATPSVRRVECQLMMLGLVPRENIPFAGRARSYERNFMLLEFVPGAALPAGRAAETVRFGTWEERYHDEAARLIAQAYDGHIDGDINDQYRSVYGARRFITNIVQYPGCGAFCLPASTVAFHPRTGRLCGISLCSLVAGDSGHVTQICVLQEVKGTGIGYELLRLSLEALRERGCQRVSLTVTAANRNAVRLYERTGFRVHRVFSALVWE